MTYENVFYYTSDGSLDIEFLFVNIGQSEWRIYILSDINYRNRSTSATDIHRLTESDETRKRLIRQFMSNTRIGPVSNRNIYYICWSNRINDLETAKEIARTWSEITAYYIKNGGTFPGIWETLKRRSIL